MGASKVIGMAQVLNSAKPVAVKHTVRMSANFKNATSLPAERTHLPSVQSQVTGKFFSTRFQQCQKGEREQLGTYHQLFLDDKSSELLAINTCKGLFRSKRLCFGVKTATAQFQRVMDTILSGIKGVMVRVDDIHTVLVATLGGVPSHLDILKQVFHHLAKNVWLNGPKCQLFEAKVKYMGHILSKQGISPMQSTLEAIQWASRPTDVSQLR